MKQRAEELEGIAGKAFDVCVIGGGATGVGMCPRLAASRLDDGPC